MSVGGGTFESMLYLTPALSVAEVRGGAENEPTRRLGWCVSLAWLWWELNIEWLTTEGRRRILEEPP